jgi:hypothetical protein
MKRRRILMPVIVCSIVLLISASAGASAAADWPTRWQVNGNGESGALELAVEDSGVLTGRLFEEPVEVLVSGRHLVIHRDTGGRTEIWDGWLSAEKTGSQRIVAGTISVAEGGETRVYPWYGTPAVTDPPALPPVVAAPASPGPPTPPAPETPAETVATSDGGPLSGTWQTPTGERMEIGQDGKQLTVKTPDGVSHSGRVTGAASLVVGLRKGCCNGTLEIPDVIVWSDGARWERID